MKKILLLILIGSCASTTFTSQQKINSSIIYQYYAQQNKIAQTALTKLTEKFEFASNQTVEESTLEHFNKTLPVLEQIHTTICATSTKDAQVAQQLPHLENLCNALIRLHAILSKLETQNLEEKLTKWRKLNFMANAIRLSNHMKTISPALKERYSIPPELPFIL